MTMPARSRAPDVLVVDDDLDIRESLREILADEGIDVVVEENGQAALALLSAGLRPRLILLDLMMPGLDGEGFCRQWAQHPALAGIPVIIISADAQTAERAEALCATGHLKKPFKLRDLLDLVHRYTGRGSAAPSAP